MGYASRLRTAARSPADRRPGRRITPGLAGGLCLATLDTPRIALSRDSQVVPLPRASARTDLDAAARYGRRRARQSDARPGSIGWGQWRRKWLRRRAAVWPGQSSGLAATDDYEHPHRPAERPGQHL